MKSFSVQDKGFDYSFQFQPKTGNAVWGLELGYSSGAISDFGNTSGIGIISGQSGIGNSISLVPPYLLLGNTKEETAEVYYNQSLESMYLKLKTGGHACIVVGNRLMSRVRIPTHRITVELGSALGFEHKITIPRRIPTKRMPWKTAPENIPGLKADTMHNEHIVILCKA